ncbi:MAG: phosphatidylserine decarboxylase [Smithella sp. PtaU1.Bin162]|nr:MAG: phosphatidylserine decarboxylase [Smithella sp. PtaU1.Bin162]
MIDKTRMPVAFEGLKLIIPLAVLTAVFFSQQWIIAGGTTLIFILFVLFFFRNPRRVAAPGNKLVVSPADGRIVDIAKINETDYLDQSVWRISIFLSIFNVHVNRTPIAGTVELVKYNPGKFHIAALPKASLENEQTALLIMSGTTKILVKQIAGIIARRILCYIQPGDTVKKGQFYGLICFGSRVDIFLPEDSEIRVKVGNTVKGAKSVIAVLK